MTFDLDVGAAAEAVQSSPVPAPMEAASGAGEPAWDMPVVNTGAPPPQVDPAIYGIDSDAGGSASPSPLTADGGDRAYGYAVGAPPSAESSKAMMDDFREVNNEPGRGAPPGPEERAEIMQDFIEVNRPPQELLDELE